MAFSRRSKTKRTRPTGALVLLGIAGLLLFSRAEAAAQTDAGAASPAQIERLLRNHHEAENRHLWRVAVWGGANIALGTSLMLAAGRSEHPARFGFGLQSGLWGVVNVGIAGVGLYQQGGDASTAALGSALGTVRGYHDILLANMGLNVAYVGVGVAMLAAGYRGVRSAPSWRGHGTALVVQGLGLLVLDGIALWGARSRLGTLLGLLERTALTLQPGGAGWVVSL